MALRCPTAQRGILPHSVAFSKPSAHPPAVRGCSCDAQQYCSTQRKARKVSVASSQWGDHNQEMLIGDNVALVTFCLYKQILALILSPTFPGWTAPLSFNVTNFEEFLGMVVTVTCTWTISSYLSADYERTTTSGALPLPPVHQASRPEYSMLFAPGAPGLNSFSNQSFPSREPIENYP